MVRHVILWRLKDEYSGAEMEEIKKGIKAGLEGLNGKTDFDDLVGKLRSESRYRDSSYTGAKQGDVAILSNSVGIIAGIDKEGSIYVIIGDNGDVCRCMRYLPERISGYYVIN